MVDKDYLAWMHERICLCSFKAPICSGRITVHHVRTLGSPKNDRRVLTLCEAHHLHDFSDYSIERLGKAKFQDLYAVDIETEILRYNEAYAIRSQKRGGRRDEDA